MAAIQAVSLDELSTSELTKQIRKAAMNLLARREHGFIELQRKLLKKYSQYDLVEQALQRLADEDLLSDERFTESYVRYRSNAGFGPVRIRAELKEKGLKADLISNHLDNPSIDWVELIRQVKNKKFGEAIANDFTEKSRQARFLQYRGFTQDQIAPVV